jgi:hypothetical protein
LYQTIVRITSDSRSTEFVFQSENQHYADLTFTEIAYLFNGLGYLSPHIRDPSGTVLANLVTQRDVPLDNIVIPVPTLFAWIKYVSTNAWSWVNGLFGA